MIVITIQSDFRHDCPQTGVDVISPLRSKSPGWVLSEMAWLRKLTRLLLTPWNISPWDTKDHLRKTPLRIR